MTDQTFTYDNITVSGKIAGGATTLATSLKEVLGWEYYNTGAMQREYDRKHGRNENLEGAMGRPDKQETSLDDKALSMLQNEKHIIYEGWLSGFVARELNNVLRVLVICSSDDIRVDRVMNRENVDLDTAKQNIRQREEENISKWKKIYGDYDFWDPKFYNLVIDTYSSGPMETLGKALDKLGYKGDLRP